MFRQTEGGIADTDKETDSLKPDLSPARNPAAPAGAIETLGITIRQAIPDRARFTALTDASNFGFRSLDSFQPSHPLP